MNDKCKLLLSCRRELTGVELMCVYCSPCPDESQKSGEGFVPEVAKIKVPASHADVVGDSLVSRNYIK